MFKRNVKFANETAALGKTNASIPRDDDDKEEEENEEEEENGKKKRKERHQMIENIENTKQK